MNDGALKVPNMNGARIFSVDRDKNSVDNCVMIHKAGHYVYGTVRKDCEPNKNIEILKDGSLNDEDFHWRMAKLPVPMSLYLWRDSVKEGKYFISTFHNPRKNSVTRNKKGSYHLQKISPTVAKYFNDKMGAVYQKNARAASYKVDRRHHKRWYMCMNYYVIDTLIDYSYIFFRMQLLMETRCLRRSILYLLLRM